MSNVATRILSHSTTPYLLPAIAWVAAWKSQLFLTDYVHTPDFVTVIYFTSGVQICSAIVFGLRGVVGTLIGSLLAFRFLPDIHYPASFLDLVLFSLSQSIIAYASVEAIRVFAHLNTRFDRVTLVNLVLIVLLYNLISSLAHYLWTAYIVPGVQLSTTYILIGFCSRVIGSFIVMYLFLAVFEALLGKGEST